MKEGILVSGELERVSAACDSCEMVDVGEIWGFVS